MRRVFFYIGIGFLFYCLFEGATIDPSNAWFWIWLLIWPLMLIAKFIKLAFIVAAVVIAAVILYCVWDGFNDALHRRWSRWRR